MTFLKALIEPKTDNVNSLTDKITNIYLPLLKNVTADTGNNHPADILVRPFICPRPRLTPSARRHFCPPALQFAGPSVSRPFSPSVLAGASAQPSARSSYPSVCPLVRSLGLTQFRGLRANAYNISNIVFSAASVRMPTPVTSVTTKRCRPFAN